MQPAKPNDRGVLEPAGREVVASRGRAFAAVNIALCEDGLYRYGVDLMYATGGFGFPIHADEPGYSSLDAARTAALERLLRAWHTPFPSDPESVRAELADMRRQIEARLRQTVCSECSPRARWECVWFTGRRIEAYFLR